MRKNTPRKQYIGKRSKSDEWNIKERQKVGHMIRNRHSEEAAIVREFQLCERAALNMETLIPVLNEAPRSCLYHTTAQWGSESQRNSDHWEDKEPTTCGTDLRLFITYQKRTEYHSLGWHPVFDSTHRWHLLQQIYIALVIFRYLVLLFSISGWLWEYEWIQQLRCLQDLILRLRSVLLKVTLNWVNCIGQHCGHGNGTVMERVHCPQVYAFNLFSIDFGWVRWIVWWWTILYYEVEVFYDCLKPNPFPTPFGLKLHSTVSLWFWSLPQITTLNSLQLWLWAIDFLHPSFPHYLNLKPDELNTKVCGSVVKSPDLKPTKQPMSFGLN